MVWTPSLSGEIERRLLINYRVDPEVAAGVLPAPFRPQLVHGYAVAGICLIRLRSMRPRGLPGLVGLSSENAAHRIAVEWDTPAGIRRGVYIPRRDTSAAVNVAVGGRLFPGAHHRAYFDVAESDTTFHVAFRARDRTAAVTVDIRLQHELTGSQLFADTADASGFFEHGSHGYSATADPTRFDGLALHTTAWHVDAATVDQARSSFFDDPETFPPGTCALDSALIMRRIPVTWKPLTPLAAERPANAHIQSRGPAARTGDASS